MDSYIELKNSIKDRGLIKKSECEKKFPKDYIKILDLETLTGTWAEKVWVYINGYHNCRCGSKTKWLGFKKGGYQKYCSRGCATSDPSLIKQQNKKRKETSLEKYGVESPAQLESVKEKAESTNIKKYGSKSPMQNKEVQEKSKNTLFNNYGVTSPSHDEQILKRRIESFKKSNFKENFKKTSIERFGAEHPWQNKEIHHKSIIKSKEKEEETNLKRKETNLKKYGTEYCISSDKVQDKIKKSIIEKFGVDNASKNKDVKLKISKNLKKTLKSKLINSNDDILSIKGDTLTCKCNTKDHLYKIKRGLYSQRKKLSINTCTICKPYKQGSEMQDIIKESLFEDKKINDRKLIYPYEIDILIPDKLAIEVNGMYWHSSINKDKFYHQEKAKKIHSKGIQYLTIWEDEWNLKEDILKSIINSKLNKTDKIYGRKCVIKELDHKQTKEFLNLNHLQGNVNSKIRIGLFYQDELVSIMTFGNLRKNLGTTQKNNEYELLRFANKLNTTVIGGASKLLKYFERNYNPSKLVSYAAYERSNGNLYNNLGFKFDSLTNPGYFYYKDGIRYNRFNFRKSELVKQGFDKNKIEEEIMHERKYLKCFDSGNLKYVKDYQNRT